MQIKPIQYNFNTQRTMMQQKRQVSVVSLPQNNNISNIYYLPSSKMSFKGLKLETQVIQKVLGKEFYGLDIYTPNKNYIDFLKVGYEKLIKVPFDIVKATKDEITARRFSLALAETYAEGSDFGTQWVSRYNPENRQNPLAVSHSLNNEGITKIFDANLKMLRDVKKCKSLDISITNTKGDLCLDAVVFDTETTGTKISSDKIIQIGAVRLKNGQIMNGEKGVYNKIVNPEIPIPEEASAVNGITDDMVKDSPTIEGVLEDFLTKYLNKSNGIIVGYNALKFDVPILNRTIREYRLTNNITETDARDRLISEKQLHKVLDPYFLIQRIHPFLGAKKKLSYIYEWLFCKTMENAHDAFADVKGTIDVLKYCLYYLSEHRIDKTKPLTLRQVLAFQNGAQNIPNLSIKLHPTKNFNSAFSFAVSYRPEVLGVDNYFLNYKPDANILNEIAEEIGEANVKKLIDSGILGSKVNNTYKGYPIQAAETERVPKTKHFKSLNHIMRENFKKVLGFAKLEGYNGKSKDEIEDLITEKSKNYLKEATKEIWIKNVNPDDIPLGNDLPDDDITRRVMREAQLA